MSHVATVDIEIKSLDDLAAACKRIGLEFMPGQTEYAWFGESVGDYPLPDGFELHDLGRCEHAIRVPKTSPRWTPETYEIGVVRCRDGKPGFTLLWDFWGGGMGLQEHVGENCNRLKQAYAIEAATRTARAQGFRVNEFQGADGKVRLQCVR